MKIVSVEVSALRSNGNFGNDGIKLVAEMAEGEKPGEVYAKLRKTCEVLLSGRLEQITARRAELEAATEELRDLDYLLEEY